MLILDNTPPPRFQIKRWLFCVNVRAHSMHTLPYCTVTSYGMLLTFDEEYSQEVVSQQAVSSLRKRKHLTREKD